MSLGNCYFNSFLLTWALTIVGCGVFAYVCYPGSIIAMLICMAIGTVLGLFTGLVGPVLLALLALAWLINTIMGFLG
jgi:mannitol-specific phosphotransferase system IIBC component